MSKETFQRVALVTVVVLFATVASQQLMAFAQRAIYSDHDHHSARVVDVQVHADEHRIIVQEQRELAEEARQLAEEAREMARFEIALENEFEFNQEMSDLSQELQQLKDHIRIEIQ